MDQGSRSGLVGWFRLKVPKEATAKLLVGCPVVSRQDWDWRIYLQGDLFACLAR